MFFMLVDVFSLFPGWHLQLEGHLNSWCLKEDNPMTAVPGSRFPHTRALGELFSTSVPCLEQAQPYKGSVARGDELKGELPAPYDNSSTGQTDFWPRAVFGCHGSLLNTHQCEGYRISPILFKEPMPGSVLVITVRVHGPSLLLFLKCLNKHPRLLCVGIRHYQLVSGLRCVICRDREQAGQWEQVKENPSAVC